MLNNVKTAALLAGLGGLIMAVSAVVGGRSGLTFGLVIVALALRPDGLFGRAEVKKV